MVHIILRAVAIPLGIFIASMAHPVLNLMVMAMVLASYYILASYWEFHGDESDTPGSPAIRVRVHKTLSFFHGAWGDTLAVFVAFFIASSIFHIGESDAPFHEYTDKTSR